MCVHACLFAWTDHLPWITKEHIQICLTTIVHSNGTSTKPWEWKWRATAKQFYGRVTWQAVRQHINCDRNVHWRCLLQVSAMREQQARLLIHSRDSPASSQLECGPHLCSCSSCMLQSCQCLVNYLCVHVAQARPRMMQHLLVVLWPLVDVEIYVIYSSFWQLWTVALWLIQPMARLLTVLEQH